MVAMVTDKSLRTLNGFSIKLIPINWLPLQCLFYDTCQLGWLIYNYIILMTRYLYYDFHEQTYHVSLICMIRMMVVASDSSMRLELWHVHGRRPVYNML